MTVWSSFRGERGACGWIATLALLAGVVTAACGSKLQGALPEGEFVAAAIDAVCANVGVCCEKGGYAGVASDCDQTQATFWDTQVEAARTAHATYDGIAAARCVAQLRERVQACPSIRDPYITSACSGVYRNGDIALGEACGVTRGGYWECADSKMGPVACHATFDGSGIVRSCALERVIGVGETPSGGGKWYTTCALGLRHDDEGRCREPIQLGQACTGDAAANEEPCEAGAVCDARNTATCVRAVPIGQACSEAWQCEGYACRNGRCAYPVSVAIYCE